MRTTPIGVPGNRPERTKALKTHIFCCRELMGKFDQVFFVHVGEPIPPYEWKESNTRKSSCHLGGET
jgi:hypothetical protein